MTVNQTLSTSIGSTLDLWRPRPLLDLDTRVRSNNIMASSIPFVNINLGKFLNININDSNLIFPIFAQKAIQRILRDFTEIPDCISVPLRIRGCDEYPVLSYKTPAAFLNNFFRRIFYSTTDKDILLKKWECKNYKYYGCNGLLLDDKFNPLLILACNCHYNCDEEKLYIINPILYIDSIIYSDNNPINKYIISKVIPAYYSLLSYNVWISTGHFEHNVVDYRNFKVEITSLVDFVKQVYCEDSSGLDKKVKKILEERKDEIIECIYQ